MIIKIFQVQFCSIKAPRASDKLSPGPSLWLPVPSLQKTLALPRPHFHLWVSKLSGSCWEAEKVVLLMIFLLPC